MATQTTKNGHQAPYFSAHDIVMWMMRNNRDPEFIVAYIREEIRRDPTAFMTDAERAAYQLRNTFNAVSAGMQSVWKTLRDSVAPALSSVGRALGEFNTAAAQSGYVLAPPEGESE